jgi:energy-coupling factor transporter ATP-binding protein EcfA2
MLSRRELLGSVAGGEIISILGPTGGGKSTLMSQLAANAPLTKSDDIVAAFTAMHEQRERLMTQFVERIVGPLGPMWEAAIANAGNPAKIISREEWTALYEACKLPGRADRIMSPRIVWDIQEEECKVRPVGERVTQITPPRAISVPCSTMPCAVAVKDMPRKPYPYSLYVHGGQVAVFNAFPVIFDALAAEMRNKADNAWQQVRNAHANDADHEATVVVDTPSIMLRIDGFMADMVVYCRMAGTVHPKGQPVFFPQA